MIKFDVEKLTVTVPAEAGGDQQTHTFKGHDDARLFARHILDELANRRRYGFFYRGSGRREKCAIEIQYTAFDSVHDARIYWMKNYPTWGYNLFTNNPGFLNPETGTIVEIRKIPPIPNTLEGAVKKLTFEEFFDHFVKKYEDVDVRSKNFLAEVWRIEMARRKSNGQETFGNPYLGHDPDPCERVRLKSMDSRVVMITEKKTSWPMNVKYRGYYWTKGAKQVVSFSPEDIAEIVERCDMCKDPLRKYSQRDPISFDEKIFCKSLCVEKYKDCLRDGYGSYEWRKEAREKVKKYGL